MDEPPRTTRRDFLQGKAAAEALAAAVQAALPAEQPGAAPAGEPPETESLLLTVGRRAMACEFEVLLNAGQYPGEAEAAVAALDLVDELEAQLSVFRDSSEVSQLNRLAADGPVEVEGRLFDLLRQAFELSAATGGAYDITSGPLTKVWGFYRRAGRLPDEAELAAALALVGSQHVTLDAARRTVRFARPGLEINLGSIGKGYALDRCRELLTGEGIGDFLLHGGQSSVLAGEARGFAEGRNGWVVGLKHPLLPERRLAEFRLRDQALGTSGSGTQFFLHQGRRYGHILDPRIGRPAEGVLSATVIAPTAAEADSLSTAFYVLGREATLEFCRRRPEIAAILVLPKSGPQVEIVTANIGREEFAVLGS